MKIDSNFDGGNIEVVSAASPERVQLSIRADSNAEEFRQWFHFRVLDAKATPGRFEIVNAGATTYPDAWEGYRACASYDLKRWFRVPTEFDGQSLVITHAPTQETIHYGYFAPYSLERHQRLVQRAAAASGCRVERLGGSVQKRDMTLLTIGEDGDDKRKIWLTARQHPGETMAEWFMEGVVERLLKRDDPVTRALLEKAVFYLVPNMNPDGGFLGNLRTNAAGANLNRAWLAPDAASSPEVLCVREKMHQTSVDLFLDIHGDERNPYCFLAGCEGNPGYSERLRSLENTFEQSLVAFDPDF